MTISQSPAPSPFHDGEKSVQARMGVADIEQWARQVVRPYLPDQHRDFHIAQPFLIAAARDPDGRPWATMLTGPNGFITSADDRSLRIDGGPAPGGPAPGDPVLEHLKPGAAIGLLGIDLESRRRNRLNGRITDHAANALAVTVYQSFGNCPQYIHDRAWYRVTDNRPRPPIVASRLSRFHRDWIGAADTVFIATGYDPDQAHSHHGMDASHRGGEPGFVRVMSDSQIMFPDYAGNNHFNTIGNLVKDPRAGLLFIDFESGGLLHLTGRVTIDWDSDAVRQVPGARRLIYLSIDAVIDRPSAVPLRWRQKDGDTVRALRLVEKVTESADVTSFRFTARDGGVLPAFSAGQYLPLRLRIPGIDGVTRRTYSLSGAPGDDQYRISVKREAGGLVSNYLHDHLETGAIIEAGAPAGSFGLPHLTPDTPIVLMSAGVGLTPMVSMLHQLVADPVKRPVWFAHGARDGAHAPLLAEIHGLARHASFVRTVLAFSRPQPGDRLRRDYDQEGRLDGAAIAAAVNHPDAHYMLCGPVGFMAEVQDSLQRAGVPGGQVHTESFGPAG